jgi:hypothetical protein
MPETMTTLSAVQVTPRLTEIIGDGLAKRPIAARIVVGQHSPRCSPHAPAGDLRPRGDGKFVDQRFRAKRSRGPATRGRRRQAARELGHPSRTSGDRSGRDRRSGRGEEVFRQLPVDIRAIAGPPFQIPFGMQLFERHHGRAAGDGVLLRELARRRQLHAAFQPRIANRISS